MNMTDNQQRLLVVVLLVLVVALFMLVSWLKERRKNRIPTIEIQATVLSKRVVSQSHRSTYGSVNGLYYYVTFYLADGTVVELSTPEGSGRYDEGTTGVLLYQGQRCYKFTPAP